MSNIRSLHELWKVIEPVVLAEGLQLYDVEFAGGSRGGVLRISLWREAGEQHASVEEDLPVRDGVSIEDCARVSRKLSALDRFEEIVPERTTLEVSSPGVNRQLRRPEHFQTAVGEHVKVKVSLPGDGTQSARECTVRGVLESFDGEVLHLAGAGELPTGGVPLSDVMHAQVDFQF